MKVAAILAAIQAVFMEIAALLLIGIATVFGLNLNFMDNHPIFAMPYLQANLSLMMVMAGIFGILRLIGAIGLWRNYMWGFYLSIIMCIVTLVLMIFMLPAGIADGLLAGAALTLILIGYFGRQRIMKEVE